MRTLAIVMVAALAACVDFEPLDTDQVDRPLQSIGGGGDPDPGGSTGRLPIGYLDGVRADGTAWGWACDPDTPSTSIMVRLQITQLSGAIAWTVDVPANLASEAAVASACGGGSAHRFHYQPSQALPDGGSVFAYGLDTSDGRTAGLSSSPRREPYDIGVNVHWPGALVQVAADAGATWVRAGYVAWPNAGEAPDFQLSDQAVVAACRRGQHVLMGIGMGGAWMSSGDRQQDGWDNDVPWDWAYGWFASQVVARYRNFEYDPGRWCQITHYELWNEPNALLGGGGQRFFEGSPTEYVRAVLAPGAAAIHGQCPECKVVGPGAIHNGQSAWWLDTVLGTWWNGKPGRDYLDVVSAHGYADVEGGFGVSNFEDYLGEDANVMSAHGVLWHKPYWLTETGAHHGSYGSAAQMEDQRHYIHRVMQFMKARPWFTHVFIYEAADNGPDTCDWTDEDGMAYIPPPADPCVARDGNPCVCQHTSPPGNFGCTGSYCAKPIFSFVQQVALQEPGFGGIGTDDSVLSGAGTAYAAELVSTNLPTQLQPGQTFTATVTLRNTGSYAWGESAWYRLGAVADSDPFAAGRIHLPAGVVVGPGATYSFSIPMVAPGPGTYLTDWRMVRDAVTWFGPTASSVVTVVGSSPTSCAGHCGGSAGSCYCDAACSYWGDCCPDKVEVCGP